MTVLLACIHVDHMHPWYLLMPKGCVGSLGTWVGDGFELVQGINPRSSAITCAVNSYIISPAPTYSLFSKYFPYLIRWTEWTPTAIYIEIFIIDYPRLWLKPNSSTIFSSFLESQRGLHETYITVCWRTTKIHNNFSAMYESLAEIGANSHPVRSDLCFLFVALAVI